KGEGPRLRGSTSAVRPASGEHAGAGNNFHAGGRMTRLAGANLLRLTLARACAFALQLAPSASHGFALVALWLVALGAAATVATRGGLRRWTRTLALCAGVAGTAAGLWWSVHGGDLSGVLLALAGWAG